MSNNSKVNINTLTQGEYVKLLAKMREAKVTAVVLFTDTFVMSESGAVFVLGQEQITQEQLALFKTWLIKQYGHKL